MEISGINSIFPFQLPKSEKDANGGTPLQLADTVDVHQPELLADDEVEGVMSESMDMIVGLRLSRFIAFLPIVYMPCLVPENI